MKGAAHFSSRVGRIWIGTTNQVELNGRWLATTGSDGVVLLPYDCRNSIPVHAR